MYIERSIDTLLLEWKNSRSLKPLLLRGARQVGKSWAVEHLGESFDHFIEVNFEKRPDMKDVFEKVHDVHELANSLGLLYNKPVEPGKTLIFLDEIQDCLGTALSHILDGWWYARQCGSVDNQPRLQAMPDRA